MAEGEREIGQGIAEGSKVGKSPDSESSVAKLSSADARSSWEPSLDASSEENSLTPSSHPSSVSSLMLPSSLVSEVNLRRE